MSIDGGEPTGKAANGAAFLMAFKAASLAKLVAFVWLILRFDSEPSLLIEKNTTILLDSEPLGGRHLCLIFS